MGSESNHLYTTTDVKKVREQLLKEQGGKDLLTGLEIPAGKACLDHDHKSQYVRGVLHRQSNAVLGKIENLWTRYLSYWFEGTLQDFLRKAADYLDRKPDTRYLHPHFLKKLQTMFNSLPEASKRSVLSSMNQPEGSNGTERKKLFNKAIKTKQYTFEKLKGLIEKEKL